MAIFSKLFGKKARPRTRHPLRDRLIECYNIASFGSETLLGEEEDLRKHKLRHAVSAVRDLKERYEDVCGLFDKLKARAADVGRQAHELEEENARLALRLGDAQEELARARKTDTDAGGATQQPAAPKEQLRESCGQMEELYRDGLYHFVVVTNNSEPKDHK